MTTTASTAVLDIADDDDIDDVYAEQEALAAEVEAAVDTAFNKARLTGNDSDVVNAIALYLGTKPEWSGADMLEPSPTSSPRSAPTRETPTPGPT